MLWTEVRKGIADAWKEWRLAYWRADAVIYDPLFNIWTEVLIAVADEDEGVLYQWIAALDRGADHLYRLNNRILNRLSKRTFRV